MQKMTPATCARLVLKVRQISWPSYSRNLTAAVVYCAMQAAAGLHIDKAD